MSSHQKNVNYAKALFRVPGSREEIQTRQQNLELLAATLKSHPDLLHFLTYPGTSSEQKLDTLEKGFKTPFDPYVKRLVALILKRQKASEIRRISNEYHKLVLDSLQEVDVEVTSADPLTDEAKSKLLKKLEAQLSKKVHLIEVLDPSLIGGFTLQINNKFLDQSIKGKIIQLKRQLLKGYDVA